MEQHSRLRKHRNWAESVGDVCRHEAGHYVVGSFFGFQMNGCQIQMTDHLGAYDGGCTIVLATPISNLVEALAYLNNRCIILFAGALAQALKGNKIQSEEALDIIQGMEGRSDFAKARELFQIYRNIKYPNTASDDEANKQLEGLSQTLWREASEAVEKNADKIYKLAAVLSAPIKGVGLEYRFSKAECDRAVI